MHAPYIPSAKRLPFLEGYGLKTPHSKATQDFVKTNSLYNVLGYARGLKRLPSSGGTLLDDSCIHHVMELYRLDETLRVLLFRAIVQVEALIRQYYVDAYIGLYGEHHCFREESNYLPITKTQTSVPSRIESDIYRSKSSHVEAKRDLQDGTNQLSIWIAVECFSFGTLNAAIEYRRKPEGSADSLQKLVASQAQIKPHELKSYLDGFRDVRNVAAHGGRLWNRHFSTAPTISGNERRHGTELSTPIKGGSLAVVLIALERFAQVNPIDQTIMSEIRSLITGSESQGIFPNEQRRTKKGKMEESISPWLRPYWDVTSNMNQHA